MSTHRIRTLVPAPVPAPRGADWCAAAAAMLWVVSAKALRGLLGTLERRPDHAGPVASKSHA
jgi:hypothetical protein